MIPSHIYRSFPEWLRTRGDGYFTSRRVHISDATAESLGALVRSSVSYYVTILSTPGQLTASCSCPYAAQHGICKHMWATLRQADHDRKFDQLIGTAGPNASFMATEHWKSLLDNARQQMATQPPVNPELPPSWPTDQRIEYIVDFTATLTEPGVIVEVTTEQPSRDGARRPTPPFGTPTQPTSFVLRGAAIENTLRLLCETGRCRVRTVANEPPTDPVRWDDGPPWTFRLRVTRNVDGYGLAIMLRRPDEEIPIGSTLMLHHEGIVLTHGTLARFEHGGAFPLASVLSGASSVRVPESELPSLLESLYTLPHRAQVELPAGIVVADVNLPPRPAVVIHTDAPAWGGPQHQLDPFFLYGTIRVRSDNPATSVFDRDALTLRHRNIEYEARARDQLALLGARDQWNYDAHRKRLTIGSKKLPVLIERLLAEGWHVEADGVIYRTHTETRATVRSGVDWFELDAGVKFGDIEVSLSELLTARRQHATTIVLSDGSRGMLPLDWLARLGPVFAGGTIVDGMLRYARSQTGLLDAMLATLPDADVDATFERARTELRAFSSVAPVDPPRTFRGTLREYQRDGLGWLHFLRNFGLGGCLADDMGLGKTVQVLALLDSRRGTPTAPQSPSIIVVPRSIVFNWFREAERFTPRLRMLDHSGTDRDTAQITSGDFDVVITTYGTLRRDAPALSRIDFDYAILDEAQAIKTPSSASSKAARLLRADHRLVMTGTPIENRLEELWSLFEFLNPGMLGSASSFAALARLGGDPHDAAAPVNRDVLARALRPVILRRTKEQVARDLPPRVEQTLSVELEGAQRAFYNDLLEAYRRSLLDRVQRVGLGKSKMHILEALLRLRQAACHPVLADPRKSAAPSAKLDALIPALEEVTAEGHKALVFSQFTSFLALLRERLDASGVVYEYLDGKTRNREARVDRFQSDPACSLFLISLKAGGHGLNLTAADYVFILDPWWNPAVEAQAIDRAHRIGQTRHVIATRIVARNTIEEKILELQASKRALADAILGQDQGLLAGIGHAELEMLLG